jgi:ABC-type sugar transport system ATPase subunit
MKLNINKQEKVKKVVSGPVEKPGELYLYKDRKNHPGKVKPENLAYTSLRHIDKIYPNGVQAVYDFNLDIKEHEFIVFVGPSGCGKSTTLRMVAGLEEITRGELWIDGSCCNNASPKDRGLAMVFQSYALYPHMSVYKNMAFPLTNQKTHDYSEVYKTSHEVLKLLDNALEVKEIVKEQDPISSLVTKFDVSRKAAKEVVALHLEEQKNLKSFIKDETDKNNKLMDEEVAKAKEKGLEINEKGEYLKNGKNVLRKFTKEEIDERVQTAAKILQIQPYLNRKPSALSGGQRQRVAIGRAIVRHAKLFLMDEPLSNLDAKLRVKMRAEIVHLHESLGSTTIYVTHDQTEAMTMATRIVVMKAGRIQQIGTPIEIYTHPANLFVATFIGSPNMNILKGVYEDGHVTIGEYKFALPAGYKEAHDKFYKEQIKNAKDELKDDNAKLEEWKNMLLEKGLKAIDKKTLNTKVEEMTARIEFLNKEVSFSENALKGKHDIAYGIRPENVHFYDENTMKDKKDVTPIDIQVEVAELLGHDYYIHTTLADVDLVSKVPYINPIKTGDKMRLYFHTSRCHIFDPISEKTIA